MSLFNKPAWAKAQTFEAEDTERDLFSHSFRHEEIVADRERRKREKLERKKLRKERKESAKRRSDGTADLSTSAKKRRVSRDEDEVEASDVDTTPAVISNRDEDLENSAVGGAEVEPPRRSPRKNKDIIEDRSKSTAKQGKGPQAVELDSDSEEERIVYEVPQPAPPPEEEVQDDSDPEYAAFQRRVRQQRQQQEERSRLARLHNTNQPGSTTDSADPEPPDPTIQVFITSRIPNTEPLIVHRKLSQRLQEVRYAWSRKQGFSDDRLNDFFFTHRGIRIHDVTTCKNLGLDVDRFGSVTMKGAHGREDVDKVHLEAVTLEIFEKMEAEKMRDLQIRSGQLLPDDAADDDDYLVNQPAVKATVRLTLKAKGKEDWKLTVRPSTLISKIIAAYSKMHDIGAQSAHLVFDGERLNPDDHVQDTEIADNDCLEVHLS